MYSLQNFQNSELNMLPIGDLYYLIVNQPTNEDSDDDDGFDYGAMTKTMENSFKNAMNKL